MASHTYAEASVCLQVQVARTRRQTPAATAEPMDLETAAEQDMTVEIPASIFATPGEYPCAANCRRVVAASSQVSALHSAT